MRTSCNGCRILRKGCTDDCNIRTCLQWIESPESQANATVFLAKFYGRAGLMNLINTSPEHLRPDIFKSLLYEACGRIVDPMYGSVGLLWSGNWHHCQAAVDAVLKGSPIMQIPSDAVAAPHPINPLNGHDIRHVSKDSNSAASHDIHKGKTRTRTRFKRSAKKPKPQIETGTEFITESAQFVNSDEFNRARSHEDESMFSVETVEGSLVNRAKPELTLKYESQTDDYGEVGLELTLGFPHVYTGEGRCGINGSDGESREMELEF